MVLQTATATARAPLARACQCQAKPSCTTTLSRTRAMLLRQHQHQHQQQPRARYLSASTRLHASGDSSTIDYFQFPRLTLFDTAPDPRTTQEFIKVPYPPDSFLLEARSDEHIDAAQELVAAESELVHTEPATVFAVAGAEPDRLLAAAADVVFEDPPAKVEEGSWQAVWDGFLDDLFGKRR